MADEVLARQAEIRAKENGESFEAALKVVLETEAGRQLKELRDGPRHNEQADQWQEDLVQQRAQERKREQAEERKRAQQAAAWEQFMQEELRELELRKGGQRTRERAREGARARLAAAWVAAHEQREYLARKRAQAEEQKRAQRVAAWEWFIEEERRELELRKEGQLAGLLGEPLPGESAAALQRLASEDQRQAEEGLVALIRDGKMFYKNIEDLCPEDRLARIAAERLRMTWLKERGEAWLKRRREDI
jgi:colicin import membrane protein